MKKATKSLIAVLSIAFLLSGCNTQGGTVNPPSSGDTPSGEGEGGGEGGDPTPTPTPTPGPSDHDGYYSSISDSLTGKDLRDALNKLNSSKRKKTIGYKQHRYYYQYTERTPDMPEGKMLGFYDNALVSDTWDDQKTWNHEHVWPKSLGGGRVEGDIHMPRPTNVKINSDRGNKYYAEDIYDPGQFVREYRGISARIIFYCAIADKSLSIIDDTSGGSSEMGKLSDLLKWNLAYLPNTADDAPIAYRVEQNRNEQIYSHPQLQGNRNPFIDHPEYACKIWGTTNSETKKICGLN